MTTGIRPRAPRVAAALAFVMFLAPLLPLWARTPAQAAAPAAPAADPALPPNLDPAVSRALEWLSRQQKPDGSFDDGGPRLAVTGLALMSYLACGHTPGAGRYGLEVEKATDYLVAQVPADGYVGDVDKSNMYGQGIVALALAQVYGVVPDEAKRRDLHAALTRMVGVILAAQAVPKAEVHAGGWRYKPTDPDSDISLSGWNALALRAAQNAGIDVPREAVERAVAFVLRCYHEPDHGFGYLPGNAPAMATTGVGVLSLYLLDAGERPEAAEGARFLAEQAGNGAQWQRYPYYAMYYAAQAAHQAGGDAWPAVSKAVFDKLLAAQKEDGGWPGEASDPEPGRIYKTSMAVLTLSVPYRLLPIYQR